MSASTPFKCGAVQPRISPGDSGLDCGIVASYLADHNLGLLAWASTEFGSVEEFEASISPAGAGTPGSSKSDVKSSFSRDRAATN